MKIYLGSDLVSFKLNNKKYDFHIKENIDDYKTRLISLDNYILQDSQGIYLIPKEVK